MQRHRCGAIQLLRIAALADRAIRCYTAPQSARPSVVWLPGRAHTTMSTGSTLAAAKDTSPAGPGQPSSCRPVKLFLCGDTMLGRGVDQIMQHHCSPELQETCIKDARGYVALATRKNGPLPTNRPIGYVWGVTLSELDSQQPQARIINLETASTTSNDIWPDKACTYRMHPGNVQASMLLQSLQAANIDVCVLSNNHVLDWGRSGLNETLETLGAAGIQYTGAGRDLKEAQQPAVLHTGTEGPRVLVFGMCGSDCGVPLAWAAGEGVSGVNFIEPHPRNTGKIIEMIQANCPDPKADDIIVLSIHWGGNWGYQIPHAHQQLAHDLIDAGAVSMIHGHSSHHPKGLEIYHDKLIIYGCGDYIDDYEGINGYEEFRDDLGFMYFPTLDGRNVGHLLNLDLVPTQIKHLSIHRPPEQDVEWLGAVMNREGKKFGTHIAQVDSSHYKLRW